MNTPRPSAEFTDLPSMPRSMLRALAMRRPGLDDIDALGRHEVLLRDYTIDKQHVRKYREVCSSGPGVPITYPQLLSTALHLHLLTAPSFPLPVMGLVHPRLRLTQHRPLQVGERIEIIAFINEGRRVPKGIEFNLGTELRVDGELVWESSAATFRRLPKQSAKSPKVAPLPQPVWEYQRALSFPADAGRKYAKVSSDFNPVHLHPLSARLFGYRKPIGHGWWLLARILGVLGQDNPPEKSQVIAEFRRPIWLPSTMELVRSRQAEQLLWGVRDPIEKDKMRIEGRIQS